jgi:integrase
VERVRHRAALDWRAAPAFITVLLKREGIAAKALAFAILTAARSGGSRGMTWREVDPDAAVWRVPATRIKAGKEHRVPLTASAMAVLGGRRSRMLWCSLGPGGPVFRSPT